MAMRQQPTSAAAAAAGGGAGKSRKIFIPRDYSNGLELRFSTQLPPQLNSRIPAETFEAVVSEINRTLTRAEQGSPAVYAESCLACLTGYMLYMCIETQYEKRLKEVSEMVEEYNRAIFLPQKLRLIDPSERGLRVLEIQLLG